ncbi:hypothetical protein [Pedobacter sp. ASV12]|uniref:hypothetical protein n=1 Tax=Pedobacter sp. ASV12 TaxID=2795120 RepID=UPI0018EA725B|nr:hypothetical protein [Pedobacter sp. ASV12]
MTLTKNYVLSNLASLLPLIALCLFLGVGQSDQIRNDKRANIIEIGDYSFDFPTDFKLVKEQGVDSYVGRIEGNTYSFEFDFGLYTSTLIESPDEYLKDGDWRFELPERFIRPNITYKNNEPKVEVLSIRQANQRDSLIGKGCDYIARCRHKKNIFNFPIYLPKDTKAHYFKTDTLNKIYRKIVYAKDPKKGITGIYLSRLNSKRSLSLVAHHLSHKEQEMALRIFSTVKQIKN